MLIIPDRVAQVLQKQICLPVKVRSLKLSGQFFPDDFEGSDDLVYFGDAVLIRQEVLHRFLIVILRNFIVHHLNVGFFTDVSEGDVRGCVV